MGGFDLDFHIHEKYISDLSIVPDLSSFPVMKFIEK